MKFTLKVKKQNKVRGAISNRYRINSEVSRELVQGHLLPHPKQLLNDKPKARENYHKQLHSVPKGDVLSVRGSVTLFLSVQIVG